jgi:hypothetical protein
MPLWMNMSVEVFKNKAAHDKWGWVQEMYAFAISLWKAGVRHVDLHLQLASQPPWDTGLEMKPGKPFYILHYTYGMDYDLEGTFTPGKYGAWRFDKRTYSSLPPPRHLGAPPVGMKNDLVRALINGINEASDNLPCWDDYARTGRVTKPKDCHNTTTNRR